MIESDALYSILLIVGDIINIHSDLNQILLGQWYTKHCVNTILNLFITIN